MELSQAIKLIQGAALFNKAPSHWADLGSGKGLFTRALAHCLAPGSRIDAVDRNPVIRQNIPFEGAVEIRWIQGDFISDSLPLQNIDGILMANSLHFVSDKPYFIRKTAAYFGNQKQFLFVEYDTDVPNQWVPYPISFLRLREMFTRLGFPRINKISEMESRYRNSGIYSALVSE